MITAWMSPVATCGWVLLDLYIVDDPRQIRRRFPQATFDLPLL